MYMLRNWIILLFFFVTVTGCTDNITEQQYLPDDSGSVLRKKSDVDLLSTSEVEAVLYRKDHVKFTGKIKYFFKVGSSDDYVYGSEELSVDGAKVAFANAANEWNKTLHNDNKFEEVSSTGSGVITVDFSLENPVCNQPRVQLPQGGQDTQTICLPPGFTGFTAYQTSLHELSHVLGLEHFGSCKLNSSQTGLCTEPLKYALEPSNGTTVDPLSVTAVGPLSPSNGDKQALHRGVGYAWPVVPPPSAPSVPTGLSVSPISHGNSNQNVTISWNQHSDTNVTGYKIYRRMWSQSSSYSLVKTISSRTTISWLDTSVPWPSSGLEMARYKMTAHSGTLTSNFTNWAVSIFEN